VAGGGGTEFPAKFREMTGVCFQVKGEILGELSKIFTVFLYFFSRLEYGSFLDQVFNGSWISAKS